MKPVLGIVVIAVLLLAILSQVLRQNEPVGQLGALAQGMPFDSSQADNTLSLNAMRLPPRGPLAPEIASDTWFNSPPLMDADLRGRVTAVEFWTFDCINCRNTIPQMRSLYEKYHDKGLMVIGVHSPELSFERDAANVQNAIQDLKIPYAVALDNDFKNWNAFHVWAWPTVFILDKQGTIRFTHVGEGAYAEAEQVIAGLLNE